MSQTRYRKPIAVIAALSLVVGLFPTGALGENTRDTFDQQQVSDIAVDKGKVGAEPNESEPPAAEPSEPQIAPGAPEEATQPQPEAPAEAPAPEQPATLSTQAGATIESVSFIVVPPEVDASSEFAPTVSVPSGAAYAISDSGWFNADGSYKEPTDPDYTFEAGKTYKFFVDVTAESGKALSDAATAAVSGGTLEGSPDVYNSPESGLSALTAVISVKVTAKHGGYTDDQGVKFSYEKLDGSMEEADSCAITQIYLPNDAAPASVDVKIPSEMEGLVVSSLGAEDHTMTLENENRMRSLTIPASVEAICGPYFKYQPNGNDTSNLATVTFEKDSKVTELPAELFAGSGLVSITLPSGLVTIGESAFASCQKLAAIDVPARVRTIGEKAFFNCKALTDIGLREGLATIGASAFGSDYNDMTYTTVAIPNSVESIGSDAFASESLTSVSLGTSMSESHLTEIGDYAFNGTSLTSVEIPNSVESIGEGAFYCRFDRGVGVKGHGVSTLASVTFGTSQAESHLQTIGPNAFGSSALTEVTLPNGLQALETADDAGMDYNGEFITGGPFSQSPLLETIVWPKASSASLVQGFNGCDALTDPVVSSLPAWVSEIGVGAFSYCGFNSIEIPASVTSIGAYAFVSNGPESITISEEGNALAIGEHAFACESAWSISDIIVADEMVVDLPARVASIGPKAFAGLRVESDSGFRSPTFVIHNPGIVIGATEDEWPIEAAKGTTVRYPENAGESFMTFKAAVEAYEAELAEGTFNPTVFEVMEDEPPSAVQHSISVTAPAGATMQLAVNGDVVGEATTTSPLTAKADEGSQVAVIVSLDGYKDYVAQPEGGWLNADWTCAVAESDLIPLSDTGSITVTVTKDGKSSQYELVKSLLGSTVAVYDADGRLVGQDAASTSLTLHFDKLEPGSYTVVAFDKNDYFSSVNSLDDFARLGVQDGSWATGSARVAPDKISEISLTVPDLQVLAASEILESGSLVVPTAKPVPDCTFYARADYAMKDGREADKMTVSIPAGIEFVGAYTEENRYGMAGFDADARVLTVNLSGADRQSASLYVGLKVVDPGSYSVSASVTSGAATAPVGSALIEAPALRLAVPQVQLTSPEFKVGVHAAPGATVHFRIGDTDLETTATTNMVGVGAATLTIPEAERLNGYVSVYGVTAMVLDDQGNVVDQASQTVDYPITHVIGPEVREWEFSFQHAGQEVFLVKDGVSLDDVYYTCVMGTHNAFLFQPYWPFKSVLDSEKPLAPTARLTLQMLDGTLYRTDMNLEQVENLPDGVYRHTYTANVKIGSGLIDVDLTPRDIPCGFEVVPSFADEHFEFPEVTPQNTRDIQPLLLEPLAIRVNWEGAAEETGVQKGKETDFYYQYAPDAYAYLLEQGIDMETGNVLGTCVFDNAYKHENWDSDGSVWNGLSKDERQALLDFEAAMDSFLQAWQELMGTEKPMNEYEDFEDYINSTFNHETGTGAPDPERLKSEGWQVCNNDDTEGDASDWYAVRFTPNDDFGKDIANGGDPRKYTDKVTPDNLPEYGNDAKNGGDPNKYQNLVDPNKPVDSTKRTGTIECIQVKDNTFDKINRNVNKVPNIVAAAVTEGQNYAGQKLQKAAPIMRQSGKVAGARVAAGASKVLGVTSIASTGVQMHQNHITMAQLDNRLYNYAARSFDLAKDLLSGNIVDTECGKAMLLEGAALYAASYWNMQRRAFLTVDNVVSLEVTTLGFLTAENPAASQLLFKIGLGWTALTQAGDNFVYGPLSNYTKSLYDKFAQQRIDDCLKTKRLAHGANAIVDPSGWVYEAVDDNRLEGVTATVYQLVNNVWEKWNASLYGQVNGQTTGSWGIFGWDVPQGTWKVVLKKEGYSDKVAIVNGVPKDAAETDPMDVLPEYRNIAVGLVSTQAPAIVSTVVEGDAIVVGFSQYMKTGAMPATTIDGIAATPTWVDPVEGTNAEGEKEPMAKLLRIPLPAEAEPGDVLHVVLSGGANYAGTQFDNGEAYVVVPGEAPSYYYVQPPADPAFTKGLTDGLAFTFKRTLNDEKTYSNFAGAQVDGKAIERDKEYTAAEGSVVITLNAAYLETLDEGDHTLTAQFDGDNAVSAKFSVKALAPEKNPPATKPGPSNTPTKPDSSNTAAKSSTAKTGDALPIAALAFAAALSAAVLLATRPRRNPDSGKHAKR